ncbi:unnamed protein product [Adineta ricciae]|uniref:G-protein coupled receptors family 1 profile domain-containing protein n=1 Tax=Adineta ricciae TaxID=249248 RepID=A0A815DXC6_ADIRI|nr:unnamed protein product [Adineta ricciae]
MSNSSDLVSTMNYVTMQINRHGPTVLLLFGTLSNVLNICILRERSLKKIPCTIYLCWSSLSATVFIWSGLLTRVLQGYSINWPNENQLLCKTRLYLLNISWSSAIWILVGANIDRFLCSHQSVAYRRLIYTEVLHCVEARVPNVPVSCYGRDLPCRIINDWVSCVLVLDLPFGLYRSYASVTVDVSKSQYRVAIENFIYSLIVLLVHFTHSTSFYIYTLTGTLYRATFNRLKRRYFNFDFD